ncbi:hypothetical protein Tco_0062605 [Tanacetum coccineum]
MLGCINSRSGTEYTLTGMRQSVMLLWCILLSNNSELTARVTALEKIFSDFEQKSKTLDNTTQNLISRVFTLELRGSTSQDQSNTLEASMERALRDEFLAKKDKSRKRRRDNQDPPPPPPDSDPSKKRRHTSEKTTDTREAPLSSSKQ